MLWDADAVYLITDATENGKLHGDRQSQQPASAADEPVLGLWAQALHHLGKVR